MKIIIVGCGRMGSELARILSDKGNDVVIISADEKAFELLWPGFTGKKVVGMGFDKDVLEEAGIETADSVVACTNSDESNALIARLSWQKYQVPRAIARLYDSRKASLYDTLGIQTISTTAWGIRRVTELLSYKQLDSVLQLGSGEVEIVKISVPPLLVGRPVSYFNRPGEIQVVAIRQGNKRRIPTDGAVMQSDDALYVAVENSALDTLKSLLSM